MIVGGKKLLEDNTMFSIKLRLEELEQRIVPSIITYTLQEGESTPELQDSDQEDPDTYVVKLVDGKEAVVEYDDTVRTCNITVKGDANNIRSVIEVTKTNGDMADLDNLSATATRLTPQSTV